MFQGRHALLFCLLATSLGTGAARARELTFADRVRCQEAIDRVHYSHQIGVTRPFEEALPRLLNSLAQAPPCALVIDDVDRLDSHASRNALTYLIEYLPSGVRLLTSARGVPGLPLGRLRARGSLLELGPSDLAFSRQQAAYVFAAEHVAIEPAALAIDATSSREQAHG